jgi:hypothetical protein
MRCRWQAEVRLTERLQKKNKACAFLDALSRKCGFVAFQMAVFLIGIVFPIETSLLFLWLHCGRFSFLWSGR